MNIGGAELEHQNFTTVRLRGVEDLFRCQWWFVALVEIFGGVNDMFGDIADKASMTEVCSYRFIGSLQLFHIWHLRKKSVEVTRYWRDPAPL